MAMVFYSVMCMSGVVMAESKQVKKQLKKYYQKRDTAKSGEPNGNTKVKSENNSIFVIQKHDARHLHYDFRLEIDGVLVSWAVPKGPSLNPSEKRLAIQTEDHPLSYADFEGVIPQGEYGGGTVMIWDAGTYTNIKEEKGNVVPMKQCLKQGRIEIFLHGQKLHGAFALIRVTRIGKNEWLLIKINDEYASKKRKPVNTQNKSVQTGRTLHQIKHNKIF